nr:Fic family protein [Corynebacterium cystitidis]
MYADVWHKTGALLDSIESNHPLLDGNKRLGVLLVSLLLRSYGVDDCSISDDQWFDLMVEVATHHPDVEAIAARLRQLAATPPKR